MDGMRHTFLAALAASTLLAGPAAIVGAQSVRPVPTGPVNVIRPSQPAPDAARDTSRTVFFDGPRPAPPPAEDVPGHDLVIWRSSSPLVRGVAGADAAYLAAFDASGGNQRGRGAIGRSAGPVFIGGGFWAAGPEPLDDPFRHGARVTTPRVVGGDLPRPWIGGVQWNLPATPVVEPPRNTAVYPIRRP